MSVLVIQHEEGEDLGLLAPLLRDVTVVRPDKGDAVPRRAPDGLIVLGGSAGVGDGLAHIADEIALVQTALSEGAAILGICLGSQILAAALGARVSRAPEPEIGWHSLTTTAADPLFDALPRTLPVLHWHQDIFDLPQGATSLASSERTQHQAFVSGTRAYGILCHLEATESIIAAVARNATPPNSVAHLAHAQPFATALLSRWAALLP